MRVADTTIRLAEAAEAEFAEHGIDGASVRRIAAQAGQCNTNAVGYHYGSKAALADSVYLLRQPMVDGRRGELRAALHPEDIDGWVTVIVRPFFDVLGEPWGRTYLRFLSQYAHWLRTSGHADVQGAEKRYAGAPHYAAAMKALSGLAGGPRTHLFEQLLPAALGLLAGERDPDPHTWIGMFAAGLGAMERTR